MHLYFIMVGLSNFKANQLEDILSLQARPARSMMKINDNCNFIASLFIWLYDFLNKTLNFRSWTRKGRAEDTDPVTYFAREPDVLNFSGSALWLMWRFSTIHLLKFLIQYISRKKKRLSRIRILLFLEIRSGSAGVRSRSDKEKQTWYSALQRIHHNWIEVICQNISLIWFKHIFHHWKSNCRLSYSRASMQKFRGIHYARVYFFFWKPYPHILLEGTSLINDNWQIYKCVKRRDFLYIYPCIYIEKRVCRRGNYCMTLKDP